MDGKDTITVTGIMSGTSLDGLDLARVQFSRTSDGEWVYEILEFSCEDFPAELKRQLENSMTLSGLELSELDVRWAEFASECVNRMKGTSDLIASHGHTIFHRPERGFTVQIGSGAVLAARTGKAVVCDLRSLDVAHGGTGAPLIPIVDELLFSEYDACLNLGGFSNVSMKIDGELRAWDIGPCNNLLNRLAREIGLEYDKNGELASAGKVNEELLGELLNLEYHRLPAPKSLGMEWVNEEMLPILEKWSELSLGYKLRTSVEYIAKTIAVDLPKGQVLFTGGGARNRFLMERIRELASQSNVVVPSGELIDAKEAIGFAFLGLLRWRGEENVRKSVTGARIASSGGAVWVP